MEFMFRIRRSKKNEVFFINTLYAYIKKRTFSIHIVSIKKTFQIILKKKRGSKFLKK